MRAKKLAKTPDEGKFQSRPPIVVVLGHVDHGKTSLLDKIRKTTVAAYEAGGITQHIGAYQVEFQGKKITFIDTPGHVAFLKMRSRGAKVADLVVLVVAADEGVKPQTLESLEHIKKAKIPYLVAINKIDLPGVDLDWVKKNLAENNILVEGYGGKIVAVPVSAKTSEGIDQLLEMILLLGEMRELKGDPEGKLEAAVLESRLDPRRGSLASILIRNGSLRIGEELVAEGSPAKIKAMFNEKGETIQSARPSQPVEVLGFIQTPPVGAKVEKKPSGSTSPVNAPAPKAVTNEAQETFPEDGKKLKIILKSDVTGTLEAIKSSLSQEVKLIWSGVGNVNESDVLLASTTKSEIIGFRVKVPTSAKKLAEVEGVRIKIFQIIYELLEEIEKRVLKILEPTIDEDLLGRAEIVAEFVIKKQRVAGCRVKEGEINKGDRLHLKRGEEILEDCQIASMRTGKTDVRKAKKGEEFGAVFSGKVDFKIGDMLISFRKLPPGNG